MYNFILPVLCRKIELLKAGSYFWLLQKSWHNAYCSAKIFIIKSHWNDLCKHWTNIRKKYKRILIIRYILCAWSQKNNARAPFEFALSMRFDTLNSFLYAFEGLIKIITSINLFCILGVGNLFLRRPRNPKGWCLAACYMWLL